MKKNNDKADKLGGRGMIIVLMFSIAALIICVVATIVNFRDLNQMEKYVDDLEERVNSLIGEEEDDND